MSDFDVGTVAFMCVLGLASCVCVLMYVVVTIREHRRPF